MKPDTLIISKSEVHDEPEYFWYKRDRTSQKRDRNDSLPEVPVREAISVLSCCF